MAEKSFVALQADDLFASWDSVRSVGKPVIAAVAGYALDGGCEVVALGRTRNSKNGNLNRR